MMLQALAQLAHREGLLENADYEKKRVAFFAAITLDGKLVALIPTADESGRDKEIEVPRMPKRTSGVTASYLFDNAKYVLGIGAVDSATGDASDDPERLEKCTRAFYELAAAVIGGTSSPGLLAILRFGERLHENQQTALELRPASEWTGSENLAFVVHGKEGEIIHRSLEAQKAWAKHRQASEGELGFCLVSGEVAPIARLHGSIKGVPNSQSSGATLVGFNADSFASQGHEQGSNAPISQSVAEAYVTGLNYLLQGDPASGRRHRYGLGIGDSVLVVWTKDAAPEVLSLLDLLEAKTPEEGLEVPVAPFKGLAPSDVDATAFYAVMLGGNAARVVVRDWLETTLAAVKESVRRFFSDLELAGQQKPPAIWELLKSLDPPGKAILPPNLSTRLAAAALKEQPFPRELLRHALMRLRVTTSDEKLAHLHNLRRVALIKGTLIRTYNKEVSVSLDESNHSPPYLLGRLFAVLERLQQEALPGINATIRDRYFGAASSTPGVVLPRLIRMSAHHASKAAEKGRWLEQRKAKIIDALPAERFPALLPLQDQGLFAVGYYHQREDFFRKRDTQIQEAAALERNN